MSPVLQECLNTNVLFKSTSENKHLEQILHTKIPGEIF